MGYPNAPYHIQMSHPHIHMSLTKTQIGHLNVPLAIRMSLTKTQRGHPNMPLAIRMPHTYIRMSQTSIQMH